MAAVIATIIPFVVFVVLLLVFYRINKRTRFFQDPRVRLATQIFVSFSFLFNLWVAFHRLLIIVIATPVLLLLFLLAHRGVFKTRGGQLFLWALVVLFLVIVSAWELTH